MIGSYRNNHSKPIGIKWPYEPIKALGVYYSYDLALHREKNFIENLDKIKKLLNLWSSRSLLLYGKVTVIQSLVIPKFVYMWRGTAGPSHLRNNTISRPPSSTIPSFPTGISDENFCVNTKKSRDYYSLLISKKAKLPNGITFLHRDFNLSERELQQVFLLPQKVAIEPYVRPFQYQVLNRILYTNEKLHKIGFIPDSPNFRRYHSGDYKKTMPFT